MRYKKQLLSIMFFMLTVLSFNTASAIVVHTATTAPATVNCKTERWVPGHWYHGVWIPGRYVTTPCAATPAATTTTVAHPYHRHPVTRSTIRHNR